MPTLKVKPAITPSNTKDFTDNLSSSCFLRIFDSSNPAQTIFSIEKLRAVSMKEERIQKCNTIVTVLEK